MPYPKDHRARTRQRILGCAARLFAAHGFAGTSIEQIMAASRLTRGVFYSYFRSKAHLYEEAMAWQQPALAGIGAASLDDVLAGRWAFLASDVANRAPEVRAAYAQALQSLHEMLEQDTAPSRDAAGLSSVAMVVGTLAIAASVDDARLRQAVGDACQQHLQRLREGPQHEDRSRLLWSVEPCGRRALAR